MFKNMVNYHSLSTSEKQIIDSLDKQMNAYLNLIASTPKNELKAFRKPFADFLNKGLYQINIIKKHHNISLRSHWSTYGSNTTTNDNNTGFDRIWITTHTVKPEAIKSTTFNRNKTIDRFIMDYLSHKHGVDRD